MVPGSFWSLLEPVGGGAFWNFLALWAHFLCGSGQIPGPFLLGALVGKMEGTQNHRFQYEKAAFSLLRCPGPCLFWGPPGAFWGLSGPLGAFWGFRGAFGVNWRGSKNGRFQYYQKNAIFIAGRAKS